jgi:outer membrane protein W
MLVILCMSAPTFAQQNTQLYNIPSPYERYSHYQIIVRGGGAIPTGSFATGYIDKATIDNYSIAVDWIFQKPFSIGLELGQTFFSKRLPRAVYNIDDQVVSAVQTRTISLMPLQGVANFYLGNANARIRPYLQLAAGGSLLDYTLYYGNLANQEQTIKLSYGAGVGSKFLFKKDGSIGADIRVRYNQTALNFDYIDNGVGQLNATAGLFYRWW